MQKAGPLLILIASIGFILVGVAFTFLTDKKAEGNRDIRTKAAVAGSTVFTGIANEYNLNTNSLTVSQLKFADTESAQDLGTWDVKTPENFKFSDFPIGTKIKITGQSSSFKIENKTLTALEIKKN